MATKKDANVKKTKRAKPEGEFAPLSFKEFTITRKRSGRFQVATAKGQLVGGADKVKVLLDSKVLKGSFKKSEVEVAAT